LSLTWLTEQAQQALVLAHSSFPMALEAYQPLDPEQAAPARHTHSQKVLMFAASLTDPR